MVNRELLEILLQIYSIDLIIRDYKNTDLMQELQKQDSDYLEKIIEQNKEIIELLKKGEQNGR